MLLAFVSYLLILVSFVFCFLDAPEITHISDPQTLNAGELLTLNCTADGNPAPSITWTRLSTGNIVNMPLTVTGKEYEGGYRCTASNSIKTVTQVTSITVKRMYHVIGWHLLCTLSGSIMSEINTPYSKMAANKLFFCWHVNYPFRLIFTLKFFCFLYMLTRQRGLINKTLVTVVCYVHFASAYNANLRSTVFNITYLTGKREIQLIICLLL